MEIFTSLPTSVAISKAWVNNYIVAAVGHTLSACNSCCKSSRMVLVLAMITRNVTKIARKLELQMRCVETRLITKIALDN